jgi:hypothetical protein
MQRKREYPFRGSLTRIKFFLPEVLMVISSALNDLAEVPDGIWPREANASLTGMGVQHASG